MNAWNSWMHRSLAFFLPMLTVSAAFGQEAPQTTKTVTVVVSAQDGKPETILEQLRQQLKNTGIPEDEQTRILKQVEESMARKSDIAKGAATVVIQSDRAIEGLDQAAKELEKLETQAPKIQLNMEDLRNRIEGRLKGRLQLGGPGVSPSYRIGLSLAQKQDADEDDEGEDDDEDEEDDEDEVQGMVVEEVMEDSPASKAGIQSGDIIVSVNGRLLKNFSQLQEVVQDSGKADKPVALVIRRDDKDIKIKVKPVKTEASDVGVMEMNLIPQQGMMLGPSVFLNGKQIPNFSIPGASGSESLEKEVAELKEEINELKKMVKKLLEK
jgi:membrane-associated protease RseP (regulator of RpoE activity)